MPRWERLLYGPEAKVKTELVNLTYEGLVDKIRSRYLVKDADSLQPSTPRGRRAHRDLQGRARPATARG